MKKKRLISLLLVVLFSIMAYFIYQVLAVSESGIQGDKLIQQYYYLNSSSCFHPNSNVGIATLCTQTYYLKNSSVILSPVVEYMDFKFESPESAYNFLSRITQYMNSTPWPYGTHTNVSYFGNVVYTTEAFSEASHHPVVYTVYYRKDAGIVAVSVLKNDTFNNTVAIEKEALSILNYAVPNLPG